MADPPTRYPMWRGSRRRRSLARRLRRISVPRGAATAILVLAALVGAIVARGARPDPRLSYPQALASLAADNYSAARNHALDAVRANPRDGLAQAVLARAYLELGDGLAAEAALQRAEAAGVRPARLHQLHAAARLLQGDADGALVEAGRAAPAYAAFARRVRARALAAQGDPAAAQRELLDLLQQSPEDAAAWTDLGRIRQQVGDIGGAAQAAARAIAADHAGPAALTLQGEVMRGRYGLVAALPWFEAALKRDAYFPPALIEYAATLGDLGRNADALAAARKALAARPGSPPALYLMAVIAARAGKVELARSLLAHAGDALDDLPGALLLGGSLDYAQGHSELAVSKWRDLLDEQPWNFTARRLLGAALLRSGDPRGALDTLAPIIARGDADSYALEVAARAARATGDSSAAAALHDRAISAARAPAGALPADGAVATLSADAALSPGDPSRVVALIRAMLASGDQADAIARAQALAEASPGAPAAQLVLGDALLMAGRSRDAAMAYARAADLSFDEPTMLKLVDALGRADRPRDAARALALYLAQNPRSPTALRLAGHWQVAAGDDDAAIETLEAVRQRVGDRDAALLTDLALAYAGAGEGEVARRYAQAAYRLAPLNTDVVNAYATALAAADDEDGASQLRAKAVALAANPG